MTLSSLSRRFLLGACLAACAMAAPDARAQTERAATPDSIGIDYAYYNPVSLLLMEKGWLEEEFADDDVDITWVLSLGSNKALEFLNGDSIQFGSTAGAAALIARTNGVPIKGVYIYSKPEWTALVTGPDSPIRTVAELRGKRVAVTRGTDPHIFLLRALQEAGLSESDITPVLLQHPDGLRALQSGQVDAWAGLDPHMARGEIEAGDRLFYRNADFNTYGLLNVREDFAQAYPETVSRVLAVYERARLYAIEHPDELRAVLVDEANIPEAVAAKQLDERTDLSSSAIGQDQLTAWTEAGQVLQEIGVIKSDIDIKATVGEFADPSFVPAAGASSAE
ncbi:aliphatic sulfonate ABC transporter substrate-binding protein [Marinivivus vitaminiproducens]|uniref:aliphatic sulfonate ABC transporter substrate-binding protein n=1 Tax=Marinivivus vitaminiproducens TaxID=3035935 RepID=UPI002797D4BA|nr:aliphatic sulfonate ABC transporter substrate-binding protein [Geminicoccaceae bacterium SCSIO 64248]